jgi:glucose/arabinose dehydrogenase
MRFAWLAVVVLWASAVHAQLSAVRVASGLAEPIFVAAPPGDPRLFVVERGGRVRVMQAGVVLETPFLDISSQVNTNGEGGLLGLAFHPDYAENGTFYLYFTALDDTPPTNMQSSVARFTADGDPETSNVADPASQTALFLLHQPARNHNGGTLAIRDGYLYLGLGDGGFDSGTAQDDAELFGKLLRLDLAIAAPSNQDWEPYAKGLRNPFRFGFDRLTGDLYIGDVGEARVEEIDAVAADAPFGLDALNFGWNVCEGNRPSAGGPPPCGVAEFTDPIFVYEQPFGPDPAAVTGGVVYRGDPDSPLYGWYVFGDSRNERLWRLRWTPEMGLIESEELTGAIDVDTGVSSTPGGNGPIDAPVAFGEDADGEIYVVDLFGEIFRLVPEPGAGAAGAAALAALALRSRTGRPPCARAGSRGTAACTSDGARARAGRDSRS